MIVDKEDRTWTAYFTYKFGMEPQYTSMHLQEVEGRHTLGLNSDRFEFVSFFFPLFSSKKGACADLHFIIITSRKKTFALLPWKWTQRQPFHPSSSLQVRDYILLLLCHRLKVEHFCQHNRFCGHKLLTAGLFVLWWKWPSTNMLSCRGQL